MRESKRAQLQAAFNNIVKKQKAEHFNLWSEAGTAVQNKTEPAWEEYPRPQMKRDNYLMLNDGWRLDGKEIRIPFPPQALLSEYDDSPGTLLVYEKEFRVPKDFTKERILLHFGAVDQVAEVYVNDTLTGRHEGGYLPFCFDITEYVVKDGNNQLLIRVTDTLSRNYPYGKQSKKRGGMWYTPVSGIWQSVWLENVPCHYIEKVILKPDLKGVFITVMGEIDGFDATVTLENGQKQMIHCEGKTGRIDISDVILWTTECPYLYDLVIKTKEDRVETYFALRTIEIREVDGISRVCLNGKPVFLHGILDQGYYSDGLYLAANEKEYERDILRMKELGFNLLRKHIKVEPECFYYYCDKHGMLVMQDMVNNGSYHFLFDTALPTIGMKKRKDTCVNINGKKQRIFIQHTKETIEHLYNHPSIIAYTIFNEGWGQFHSDRLYEMVKTWDNTRLVDAASGWFAQEKNDFDSEHIYFKIRPLKPGKRPFFLSECGGYTLLIPEHHFNKNKSYGYGACENVKELTDKIEDMYRDMVLPCIKDGVCGCVYTQLSDVEDEVNGLYTYDRAICKVEKERMQKLAEDLYAQLQEG